MSRQVLPFRLDVPETDLEDLRLRLARRTRRHPPEHVPDHSAKLDRPPTDAEQDAIDAARHYVRTQSGYGSQQATRPQTLGYGLADSPAGQAMWIYEKFAEWAELRACFALMR